MSTSLLIQVAQCAGIGLGAAGLGGVGIWTGVGVGGDEDVIEEDDEPNADEDPNVDEDEELAANTLELDVGQGVC